MAGTSRLLELPLEIRTQIYAYLVPKMLTIEPRHDYKYGYLFGIQVEAKEPVCEGPFPPTYDDDTIVWERRCGASVNDFINVKLTCKMVKSDIDNIAKRDLWVMLHLDSPPANPRELFRQTARADVTHFSLRWLSGSWKNRAARMGPQIVAQIGALEELLRPESATFPNLQQIDLLFHADSPVLSHLIGLKRITMASKTMRCVYNLGDSPSDCFIYILVQEGTDISKIKQTDLRGELGRYDQVGLVELDIDAQIRQAMRSPNSYLEFANYYRESDDEWLYDVLGSSVDPNVICSADPMRGGLDPDGRLFADMVDL
jgi:hypothetical protein